MDFIDKVGLAAIFAVQFAIGYWWGGLGLALLVVILTAAYVFSD